MLHKIDKNKGIYDTEENHLSMKLKSVVSDTPGISQIRTIDGNIHCKKDGNNISDRPIVGVCNVVRYLISILVLQSS